MWSINSCPISHSLALIISTGAHEDTLADGALFKVRISKQIKHMRLNKLDGFFDGRRIQQIVERLNHAVIEIFFRIPEYHLWSEMRSAGR